MSLHIILPGEALAAFLALKRLLSSMIQKMAIQVVTPSECFLAHIASPFGRVALPAQLSERFAEVAFIGMVRPHVLFKGLSRWKAEAADATAIYLALERPLVVVDVLVTCLPANESFMEIEAEDVSALEGARPIVLFYGFLFRRGTTQVLE